MLSKGSVALLRGVCEILSYNGWERFLEYCWILKGIGRGESSPFSRSLLEEEVTIFRSDFRDGHHPHCLGKCFSSSDIPWTLFSWHEPSPQHPWQDDVSGKHLSKSQSPKTRVPGCWWRAVRCLDPSLGCKRGCCACPPSWGARWARRSRPRSPCPTRSAGPRNGRGELIARSWGARNGREGSPGWEEESQVNHRNCRIFRA